MKKLLCLLIILLVFCSCTKEQPQCYRCHKTYDVSYDTIVCGTDDEIYLIFNSDSDTTKWICYQQK